MLSVQLDSHLLLTVLHYQLDKTFSIDGLIVHTCAFCPLVYTNSRFCRLLKNSVTFKDMAFSFQASSISIDAVTTELSMWK